MYRYSNEHKTEWVNLYNIGKSSYQIREIFHQKYPDIPKPAQTTVLNACKKYENTGSVTNLKSCGRPKTATNEEKAKQLKKQIKESPIKSSYILAVEMGISQSSVLRIIRRNKFFSYKLQLIRQLMNDRMEKWVRGDTHSATQSWWEGVSQKRTERG